MYACVNGTRLFFDVDGTEFECGKDRMVQRPVLFLLHGGPGGDHSSFKKVAGQLRDVAQLVYIDHRGSGRSDPCDLVTNTMDQNIDDVESLRTYLGLDKVVVLGSSYGGMVAQGYALRYPEASARLILCSTAPSYRFMEEAKAFVREKGTAQQQKVCEYLWGGCFSNIGQLHEYYRVMGPMYATSFDSDKFDTGWQRGIRNFHQLNLGFTTFLTEFDFTSQLKNIMCETLILSGKEDWICSPLQSRIMADHIPQAELHIMEGAAHSLADDKTDQFLELVREFLSRN